MPENVREIKKPDGSAEVRSRKANSHLGDKFHDGPPPTDIRYCLDSAALRFVPAADLAKEGYGNSPLISRRRIPSFAEDATHKLFQLANVKGNLDHVVRLEN